MKTTRSLAFLFFAGGFTVASAQTYTFTTLAGDTDYGSRDGKGSAARFDEPMGVAVDRNGNVFVADAFNHTIRKITADGVVTTLAGVAVAGGQGSADGAGNAARFSFPSGVAVDGSGNVFVADSRNGAIRKITAIGVVTTLRDAAGNADGAGGVARLGFLLALAVDGSGNLFFAESNSNTIRKGMPNGSVAAVSNLGQPFQTTTGPGKSSGFDFQTAISFTTGASVTELSSIALTGFSFGGELSGFTVALYTGITSAGPTGLVATLTGNDRPRELASYSYSPVTPLILGQNSTYWLVASAPNTVDPSGFAWHSTSSRGEDAGAPSGWSIGDTRWITNNGGASWFGAGGPVPQFSVQVILSNAGRLTNLSIRSNAGREAQTLIVGFAIGGATTTGSKPVLIRGVGPALGGFGVPGFLVDPTLSLFSGSTVVASNDNWAGDAQVTAIGNQVAAFALAAGTSRDAALYQPALNRETYTMQLTGVGGITGLALAEIYDATPTNVFFPTTPRLVNVSARSQVGTGADILIAGFNIGGTTPKTLLIRAVGPTLGVFGLTGVLADPKLDLYSGSTLVHSNDNWGGGAAILAAGSSVGAFALDGASRDAVLLVTLQPGSYTAQISGVGSTTGVALVEIYDLDP